MELVTGSNTATPMEERPERLLTTKEACVHLFGRYDQATRLRLYRAYRAEQIGSIKLTGQHYWRLHDLDLLMSKVTLVSDEVKASPLNAGGSDALSHH